MKTIKRIMAVLLSTATIICYIPTIAVYAAPVDDIEISPEEEDEVIVESFAEDSMSAEDSVVVKVEGNAVDSVDESSINAIKDILSKNVGENETSTINILIEENSVEAYDGTAIKNKLDEAFEGATVPIEETYLSIQITQDITSESGTVSYTITDLGSVIDIVYTPANGVENLKVIVCDDEDGASIRLQQLDYISSRDDVFVIDDPSVHINTQSISTYALGSAEGVFEVSFETCGMGESCDPVYTNQIGTLPTLTDPEGWRFTDWLYEDGAVANPGDPIIADTVLWAKWIEPGEIIPTKNGVVVSKNDDGEDTVTLIDGARYGKEAKINTVVGKDKKTYKITRIGKDAFEEDYKLTNLTIGSNVIYIDDDVFSGCMNLKNLTIDMVNIPDGMFSDSGITKLTIGPNVRTIGIGAFAGCDVAKVSTNKVVLIDNEAFSDCKKLTSVKITKSVKTIGVNAFSYCENLKVLNIASGLDDIDDGVFAGCESLSTLTINLTNIPDGLFANYGITKLTLGPNVQTIGDDAFSDCENLKAVSFKKVKTIGNGAFAGAGIVKVNTAKVTSIGDDAFSGCENLTSVKIAKSVKTIGDSAFSDCENLKTVTIGSGVENLGDGAFACSYNLSTLSTNMANIPDMAFKDHDMIKIKFGPNVKTIGSEAFAGCERLKSVKMGENIKTIGEGAFSDCESLRKISIGKSVTYIGANVFEGDEKLGFIDVQSEHLTNLSAVDDNFIGEIKPKATIKLPENVFAKTKAVFEEKSGVDDKIKYSK